MHVRFRIGLIALAALVVFLAPAWFTPRDAVSEVPYLDCGSNVTPEEGAAFRARWASQPPSLTPPIANNDGVAVGLTAGSAGRFLRQTGPS